MLEQSKPAPPLDNKMARNSYRLKHRLTATAYNTKRGRVTHSTSPLKAMDAMMLPEILRTLNSTCERTTEESSLKTASLCVQVRR